MKEENPFTYWKAVFSFFLKIGSHFVPLASLELLGSSDPDASASQRLYLQLSDSVIHIPKKRLKCRKYKKVYKINKKENMEMKIKCHLSVSFLFFFHYCCTGGEYCDIYKSSYFCKFTPPSFSFVPPLFILEIVSFLPFACMFTEYLHHIHPPTPFPCILPSPTGPTPETRRVLPSCSPFL
jgi:hypothetical protein